MQLDLVRLFCDWLPLIRRPRLRQRNLERQSSFAGVFAIETLEGRLLLSGVAADCDVTEPGAQGACSNTAADQPETDHNPQPQSPESGDFDDLQGTPQNGVPQGVLLETFYNIAGLDVSDLTSSARYPASPDAVAYIDSFEAPTDIADDYGVRARAFLTPPVTGDYTFWIASDDKGELWLSSDSDPANSALIASVTGWTYPREWDKYTAQQSVVQTLTAGEEYYIEALMKEGPGGDNLAVGWSGPGISGPTVIDGQYLTVYGASTNSDPVAVDDSGATAEDRAVVVSVLDNDSDSDGHPLSIGSFSQPVNGTVQQLDGYGMLSYRGDRTSISNNALQLDAIGSETELVYFDPAQTVGIVTLPDSFTITSGITGDFTTPGSRSVALVVGPINFLFHPGHSGGAFRVENPTENRTYVSNQNVGFTPASEVLHTLRVDVQKVGTDFQFDVTLTDGANSANVFTHQVTISESEVGLLDRFGYASRGSSSSGTGTFDDLRLEDDQGAVLYETDFPGNRQDIGLPQLLYTPDSSFTGVDTFDYAISDGLGGSDTGIVTVTVYALDEFLDYGDAPDTAVGTGSGNYQTLASDTGPSHRIVSGLFLGAGVDQDSDGFGDGVDSDGYAADDDKEGSAPDDEDGVNDPTNDLLITVGQAPGIDLTVTNTTGVAATLYGWIDYNADGVFDNATERASVAVPDNTGDATVTLTFPVVPVDAAINTFARFRLSTDTAAANPTGQALDGEVEDYAVHQAQTTGLFFNKVGASEELTLFSPSRTTSTYLMDKEGQIVNQWDTTEIPGQLGYLLPDGSLMRAAAPNGLAGNGSIIANGAGGLIEQFDWYGNRIWEFEYDSPTVLAHHDFEVLPNGNVLLIAWEYKTAEESLQAGRDPGLHESDILYPDHIIEVKPDYSDGVGGDIVWEWYVWDHLVQEYDPSVDNWYGTTGVEDHPELVDINYVSTGDGAIPAREDWTHANGIDYNVELDQIILSVREFSEFWVIDHSTTTEEAAGHTGGNSGMGGDILYRWGNPQAYDRGDESDRLLFYQHDARWVEPGLPGAGNITVISNGLGRPGEDFTSVEELTSPVDEFGNYPVLNAGEAHGPADTVWTYRADPEDTNGYQSGTQRLQNGNQLITFARRGTMVEVTPSGEQVWRYVSPYVASGTLGPLDPVSGNTVFKAMSYDASDFTIPDPRVAGRHLFYNNSYYDDPTQPRTGDPVINANDDAAIDSGKSALMSGSLATFANYSGYSRGINGIMIDIADARGTLTADDFMFAVGNTADPGSWTAAPPHSGFSVRPGAGVDGSDRVTFTWPDGDIRNQWLEVTVLANDDTGLDTPDVHYWGNQIGETGNSPTTSVDGSDVGAVVNSPSGFTPAAVTSQYDVNKSGFVDGADIGLVVNNPTGFSSLLLFVPPDQPAPDDGTVVLNAEPLLAVPGPLPQESPQPIVDVPPDAAAVEGNGDALDRQQELSADATEDVEVESVDVVPVDSVGTDSAAEFIPFRWRRRRSETAIPGLPSAEEETQVYARNEPVVLWSPVEQSPMAAEPDDVQRRVRTWWRFDENEANHIKLRIPALTRTEDEPVPSAFRRRNRRADR